jgi:hypothetical protein
VTKWIVLALLPLSVIGAVVLMFAGHGSATQAQLGSAALADVYPSGDHMHVDLVTNTVYPSSGDSHAESFHRFHYLSVEIGATVAVARHSRAWNDARGGSSKIHQAASGWIDHWFVELPVPLPGVTDLAPLMLIRACDGPPVGDESACQVQQIRVCLSGGQIVGQPTVNGVFDVHSRGTDCSRTALEGDHLTAAADPMLP